MKSMCQRGRVANQADHVSDRTEAISAAADHFSEDRSDRLSHTARHASCSQHGGQSQSRSWASTCRLAFALRPQCRQPHPC